MKPEDVYRDAIARGESEADAAFLADIEAGMPAPPPEALYPTLCAWCQSEDAQTIVGWTSVRGTHGICEKHWTELVKGEQ